MANKYANFPTLFTAIANAIRAKTGSTALILADDFPEAIAGISGGGDNVDQATPSISVYLTDLSQIRFLALYTTSSVKYGDLSNYAYTVSLAFGYTPDGDCYSLVNTYMGASGAVEPLGGKYPLTSWSITPTLSGGRLTFAHAYDRFVDASYSYHICYAKK